MKSLIALLLLSSLSAFAQDQAQLNCQRVREEIFAQRGITVGDGCNHFYAATSVYCDCPDFDRDCRIEVRADVGGTQMACEDTAWLDFRSHNFERRTARIKRRMLRRAKRNCRRLGFEVHDGMRPETIHCER